MIKHEIIVHIGIPKTGTSSLQCFLAQNNEVLKQNGYIYPDTFGLIGDETIAVQGRWGNGKCNEFSDYILKGNKKWGGKWSEWRDVVEKTLNNYDVILSDEAIYSNERGLRYIAYLKEQYKNVRIVVFLRKQSERAESDYSEKIKTIQRYGVEVDRKISKLSIQDFLDREYYLPVEDNVNFYYERIKRFETIVGKGKVSVYLYEDTREKGIGKYFVKNVLGLRESFFKDVDRVNVSPTIMQTLVKRKFNLAFEGEVNPVMRLLEKEFENSHVVYPKKTGKMLSAEERKKIMKFFEEDNNKVAREYFGRESLYEDDDASVQELIDESEVQKKYIETLEAVIVNMAYKIKYPTLVKYLDKGKKVALYGAGFMGEQYVNDFNCSAEIILDGNKEKEGMMIGGIPVVWAGTFADWDNYIYLITPNANKEIMEMLEGKGLKAGIDFFDIRMLGLW